MNDIELNQLNIKENEKLFSQTKTESNQKKEITFFYHILITNYIIFFLN